MLKTRLNESPGARHADIHCGEASNQSESTTTALENSKATVRSEKVVRVAVFAQKHAIV
jgi:hypothetical protein